MSKEVAYHESSLVVIRHNTERTALAPRDPREVKGHVSKYFVRSIFSCTIS